MMREDQAQTLLLFCFSLSQRCPNSAILLSFYCVYFIHYQSLRRVGFCPLQGALCEASQLAEIRAGVCSENQGHFLGGKLFVYGQEKKNVEMAQSHGYPRPARGNEGMRKADWG